MRQALRTLARSPGFSLAAIVTLAVGIGANTAVFSVIDRVLLRAVTYPNADELHTVRNTVRGKPMGVNVHEAAAIRERSGAFAGMALYHHFPANLTGGDRPERIPMASVSDNYFSLLGVGAAVGRGFVAGEAPEGNGPLVVLSHALWQRRFAGDPAVIGRRIELDDDPYTVIGVMPADFREPLPPSTLAAEAWIPTRFAGDPYDKPDPKGPRFIDMVGRLAPGETPASARERVAAVAAGLRRDHPTAYREPDTWQVAVEPLASLVVGDAGRWLWVVAGAVALVLFIACANVAILLLARASARRRELGVRAALGAGRGRLVRQLLGESVVLALAGGALGVLLAAWGTSLLAGVAPASLPRAGDIQVDLRVLAFTVGLSIVTAVAAGLVPALRASRVDLSAVLKDGGRAGAGAGGQALRKLYVVAQVALATVLAAGAGLLLRSLWNAQRTDPGFEPRGVQGASMWLPIPNDGKGPYVSGPARAALATELLRRLEAIPGADGAALASALPMTGKRLHGGDALGFSIEGRGLHGSRYAAFSVVSPAWFSVLRIPIVAGRAFTAGDTADAPRVVIVNRTFADHFFPGGDPLGKRIGLGQPDELLHTIVGVVADVKTGGPDAPPPDEVYVAAGQQPPPSFVVAVRARPGAEDGVARAIPDVVRSIDPRLPVSGVRKLDDLMTEATARRRVLSILVGVFAVVALLLASFGLYCVLAYGVALRTHEIGVRVAVGASRGDVLRMVLGQALRLCAVGLCLGLAGAIAVGHALRGLLYGVAPADPLTFVVLAVVLVATSALAALVPARRALRVDPMVALRADTA